MENFLNFFAEMPSWQRLVWIVACLSFSWGLEAIIPLKNFGYKKWRHAGINFVFLGTTMIINLAFGIATVGVFAWLDQSHFGLLGLISWPIWAELLIAVLVFEFFAQYLIHYMLHRIKWMWKFHMVHHSDTKVDATTGTRHHPGDFVLREIFALIAVLVLGAPLAFYMFYRICTVFFTYLTHANIVFPVWLDKPLSLVFITPNMHKFHHHFERPWTDSNFGNITSIWDRLFGTFVYDDPRKIRFGLDVLDDSTDENVGFQFRLPFNKDIKTDY
jgi:sterol desaturase/sphingolipid hydroxylase (fatty acid hydroxylase superfamily)